MCPLRILRSCCSSCSLRRPLTAVPPCCCLLLTLRLPPPTYFAALQLAIEEQEREADALERLDKGPGGREEDEEELTACDWSGAGLWD